MNSAFVLCAYFAMVLSPCFVAQWGDLLSVRWILALARRRRTHAAESFLVSFRFERYAMAVALEGSFVAASDEAYSAPLPFIVREREVLVETSAFLEARQRIAARVAQVAVAQKLRHAAAASEKVVALPPDVPAVAAEPVSMHIRPRKPESVVGQQVAHAYAPLVFRDLAEVAASLPGGSRSAQGPDPLPPRPPGRKPGESDTLEIAA